MTKLSKNPQFEGLGRNKENQIEMGKEESSGA